MADTNPYITFFAAIAPAGSWILVITGWYFVRRDNNRREDRHERRNALDVIIQDIKNLESKAVDYYMQPINSMSPRMEVDIIRDQSALERRIARLAKMSTHMTGFSGQKELSDFGKHLTGSPFQDSTRVALDAKNRKFLEISSAALDLIRYLEDEYDRLHPHK